MTGIAAVIEDVAVIDVEDGTVEFGQDVAIAGTGSIAVIKPHEPDSGFPHGAITLDGRGRFLTPGLTDSHVHVAFNGFLDVTADFTRTLKQYLVHGVTTVVDFFTAGGHFPGSSADDIRDDVNAGRFAGPTMLSSFGCINAPGGFCDCSIGAAATVVVTREDVDRQIERIAALRPDFVKIVYDDVFGTLPNLSKELLTDLVHTAHERGLRVAVHVASSAQAADAVEAGADILGHGIVDEMPDALIDAIVARKVLVIPTLASYESRSLERWRITLPAASPPEVVARYARTRRSFFERNGQLPLYRRAFEHSVVALVKMVAAGVNVVAGSDAGTWYTFPGDSLLRELKLYVDAGLTPARALRMATIDAAAAWGFLGERGTVTAGKRADLLVLDANPLEDISALRSPQAVIHNGRIIDLDAYTSEIVEGDATPPSPPSHDTPCSPHHLRSVVTEGISSP